MRKLNKKSISRQVVNFVAIVLALVVATGYFIWDKGKDSEASAASSTIYSQVVEGQNVSIKACRIKGKLNVNVTYSKGTTPSLIGAKARLKGLGNGKDADVESTAWDKAGNLTIRNYYVGIGGTNGSSFDAFIIPTSSSLPDNGGVMQIYVAFLPNC